MDSYTQEVELTNQNPVQIGTKMTKNLGSRINMSNSELLTPRQAAALLGVTFQTVKNYIYKGRLTAYKTPGGHHRIRREDIIKMGFQEDWPSRGEMAENYNKLHQAYINTLGAITHALDARDGIVSGHSRIVTNYVVLLTKVMGISREEQEIFKLGALLHDIGKVFISERILSKPGKLTDQEYYLIRQHPEMGEKILNGVEFLKRIKPLIRHHHERFDGKGYPDGLSGEEIPLGARIISVAEAFDCISRECTYQGARSLAEATDEIRRHAGTQFDPEIVRIFLEEVVSNLRDRDEGHY
jgi:excisionase family DNA binding protein/putative nucleotidyltransferase with HDIG domain